MMTGLACWKPGRGPGVIGKQSGVTDPTGRAALSSSILSACMLYCTEAVVKTDVLQSVAREQIQWRHRTN